ncbi:WYL domain-containing protein [uncultured Roseibium sp.]|uniref:helix-turn-helix transcriptional regulator n=1 Tax=uncultured Roseibium sp. TaxID=1936171 RepID=UPI002613585C|nr:WYL domain-containing protein [uncultured Roseibium sp.]
MTYADFDVKWGVRKRMEFIEFRLFWYGRFNRPDLSSAFDISAQQATNDISMYQRHAPENCEYDPKQKSYVRLPSFEPNLIKKAGERYLLQLVAVASGWMERKETWFEEMPPVEVVSLERAPIDTMHLMSVLDAIRLKQKLTINYHSMTGSPPSERTIAPHAISHSKGVWYVRAWNEGHNDFRDYHLNRISATSNATVCDIDYDLDYQWFQRINFELAPNPKLDRGRQEAISNEYAMIDGVKKVPVRLSHAFYLMDQYNLDVAAGKIPPEKQQLVLINREDVLAAVRTARTMSIEALERVSEQ